MRKRPKLLILSSLVLIGIIVSIPLQIIIQTEPTAINIGLLLNQITVFNWSVIVASLITIVLVFNGHKYLAYSISLLLITVHINNFIVFKYGIHTQWFVPLIASSVFSVMTLLFLTNNRIRYTVKNPDKRWWLIPKRFQKTLPIWVVLEDGQYVLANTFDLSKTGTFISDDSDSSPLHSKLDIGKEVKVVIGDKEDIAFHCSASVVRKTDAKGNYPPGIGLHFQDISLIEKFHLSRILNNPTLGL